MTVNSDLPSPLIAALYVLTLPLWALIFFTTLSGPADAANRTSMLVVSGVLTLLSLAYVLKGIVLFRQRIHADATGLAMAGAAGFAAVWGEVESVVITPGPRTGNVRLSFKDGKTVTAGNLLGRTRNRTVGVQVDQVDALATLAARAGVRVTKPGQGK